MDTFYLVAHFLFATTIFIALLASLEFLSKLNLWRLQLAGIIFLVTEFLLFVDHARFHPLIPFLIASSYLLAIAELIRGRPATQSIVFFPMALLPLLVEGIHLLNALLALTLFTMTLIVLPKSNKLIYVLMPLFLLVLFSRELLRGPWFVDLAPLALPASIVACSLSLLATLFALSTKISSIRIVLFPLLLSLLPLGVAGLFFIRTPALEPRLRLLTVGYLGFVSLPLGLVLTAQLRRLFYPIEAMIEGTRELVNGNLDYRVSGRTPRFQPLADSFNHMAAALQANRTELTEQLRRVREANLLKDEFTRNITHELRTPLTGIIGYLDLAMKNGQLSEEQTKFLTNARSQSNKLLRIMEAVMDYSQLTSGEREPEKQPVHLNSILKPILEDMSNRYRENGGQVIESLLSVEVFCDPELTKTMFYCLLDNAVKFSKSNGAVKVSLKMERDQNDQEMVAVSIEDEGPGIELKHRGKIFDPFTQLDGSATRQHEGVGLGLTLVKMIAEKQNGTIKVKSEQGKGSEFTVTLPVVEEGTVAREKSNC